MFYATFEIFMTLTNVKKIRYRFSLEWPTQSILDPQFVCNYWIDLSKKTILPRKIAWMNKGWLRTTKQTKYVNSHSRHTRTHGQKRCRGFFKKNKTQLFVWSISRRNSYSRKNKISLWIHKSITPISPYSSRREGKSLVVQNGVKWLSSLDWLAYRYKN